MEDRELKELLIRAEKGDAQAQFELAEEYNSRSDWDDSRNYEEKALKWYEEAAKQGHAQAQYEYAHFLDYGIGMSYPNTDMSLEWYEKVAKSGNTEAMLKLYNLYRIDASPNKWNFDKAEYWLRKAAESGNKEAEYELGKLLIKDFWLGKGSQKRKFKPNPEEGVEWLKRAAGDGYAGAFGLLGDCYLSGTGVEKNESEAIEWYEKGAQKSDRDCCYKLGEIYRKGEIIERNYEKAVGLYEKVKWNAPALKRLGDCYYNGWGVEKDLEKAVYYYDRAADENGFGGEVLDEVALIYARNEVLHDEKKAVRLLHIACNMGDNPEVLYERAKRHLIGVDFRDEECRFENRVIRKDPEDAAHYFKRAANKGHLISQYEYGKCLLEGFGVEKDEDCAKFYLKKAAEGGMKEAQELLKKLS